MRQIFLLLLNLLCSTKVTTTAFQSSLLLTTKSCNPKITQSQQQIAVSATSEEDTVLYSDEWEDGQDPSSSSQKEEQQKTPWKKNARWNSLNPRVKLRIIQEQQAKAIANKKKREPAKDKQRRLMMMYKERQIAKKRDARVTRPTPLANRTPLTTLKINGQYDGKVISLTPFGVYVDIGTECDGLLHISQISNQDFIDHPREVFSPGDDVSVRVVSFSTELKKLRLSMLPSEPDVDPEDEDEEEPIQLEDVAVDDELWGEIRRVTAFGSYVELGAEVDGFLHFMDHPEFGVVPGAKPSRFMKVGDRIRCWVSDVDMEKRRIKLTANRPGSLPGPRREMLR